MKKRSRDREKETPVHYTPQTVVQTPWVRRTAFQGGSMDVAHDGVRGGQRRKDEEEHKEGEESGEAGLDSKRERKREKERY